MQIDILTSAADVEQLAEEWRCLHEKCGRGIFGDYVWHQLWWKHLGESSGVRLHIVTARDAAGKLTGILPLVTRRLYGLRLAGVAGSEVFDYGDVLALDAETVLALWSFVRKEGRYDIALLRDVHERALSSPVLAHAMQLRKQKKGYFLLLDFASGEAWLAAQTRKLRGDTRRKMEKLHVRGPVGVHVYRKGDAFPDAVIDALYTQKNEWFAARNAKGVFARAEVKGFLRELAREAAQRGKLYLAWLSCGGVVVACHLGFIRDGVLYLYHTTYDAAYGVYSPGNILMVETIKNAIDAGLRELDFMRGEEAYKTRFASGERTLSTYVEGRTWPGKLAVYVQSLKANESAAFEVKQGLASPV
jgi:CelD/BcsL family acetyltransferase involved in cellulose biosynthesis